MLPDSLHHLNTLAFIRRAWLEAPRPNVEIPGFDYQETSRIIRETELLDRLDGSSQCDLAQALLSQIVVPSIDVNEPSQAGLVLFHQIISMERALVGLAPATQSGDIDFDSERYADDIAEIRRVVKELKDYIPILEAQATAARVEITQMKEILQDEAEKSGGLEDISIGFGVISVSVATIKKQIQLLSSAAANLEKGSGIEKVENLLASVLEWAQKSFFNSTKLPRVESRLTFSMYLNKFGQAAASGLLVAKRVILSNLQRRRELSSRTISGVFTDQNYAIEYNISEMDRLLFERFLKNTKLISKDRLSAIVETYINPKLITARGSIQVAVFESFNMKKESRYAKKVHWQYQEEFDSARVAIIRRSLNVLISRTENVNYIGPISPAIALFNLGYRSED